MAKVGIWYAVFLRNENKINNFMKKTAFFFYYANRLRRK